MCRNIKTLYNFEPPATDVELRASATQFVRKISGCTSPSKVNEDAFNKAIDEITAVTQNLLDALVTRAKPKNREVEAEKARARSANRFSSARG